MNVETIIREAFPFEIVKLPLQGPDGLKTPHYGLFRDDNGDCIPHAISSRNQPHTTENVVTLAKAMVKSFDLPEDKTKVTATWTKYGHRVCVRPTEKYRRDIGGNKDSVWPQILIRANYNDALMASCGMYRDACRNLMMIRKVESTTVRIAHRGDFQGEFDSLVEQFHYLAAQFDRVIDIAAELKRKKVETAKFLASLYPAPSDDASSSRKTRHENKMRKILERLETERRQFGGDPHDYAEANLWELVNAVTAYVQHDSSLHGNPNKVDRAFRAVDNPASDKAWETALELAN